MREATSTHMTHSSSSSFVTLSLCHYTTLSVSKVKLNSEQLQFSLKIASVGDILLCSSVAMLLELIVFYSYCTLSVVKEKNSIHTGKL